MPQVKPAVRGLIAVVCLLATSALAAAAGATALQLDGTVALLLLLAAVFAIRPVVFGEHIHLSASHPFIFACLVLYGPLPAMLAALLEGLVGGLANRRIRPHQMAFNVASLVLCAGSGWLSYSWTIGDGAEPLRHAAVPVLLATAVFHLGNASLVAVAQLVSGGKDVLRRWRTNLIWSAPSSIAGGSLGLVTALALERWGSNSILLSLPLVGLIYYSHLLYRERIDEKKQRIAEVEQLNSELEVKVVERTQELLQLNEQLQLSNRKLAEASKLKSEFLATVSHELRTPLNAIIGFSELLLDQGMEPLSTSQHDFVTEIFQSGRNLLALINDILDLSKVEAGKMSLQLQPIDPVAVVEDAMATVGVLARNRKLELTADVDPAIDTIEADPTKLRQIFWNLLSNAVKFSDEGGRIQVTARLDGDHVAFTVADQGIGIAEGDQERIFDEFHQVDSSNTRRYGGTGLGLALVRKLLALHGGTISVTSALGVGSTFLVRMPVAAPAPLASGMDGDDELDQDPTTTPARAVAAGAVASGVES